MSRNPGFVEAGGLVPSWVAQRLNDKREAALLQERLVQDELRAGKQSIAGLVHLSLPRFAGTAERDIRAVAMKVPTERIPSSVLENINPEVKPLVDALSSADTDEKSLRMVLLHSPEHPTVIHGDNTSSYLQVDDVYSASIYFKQSQFHARFYNDQVSLFTIQTPRIKEVDHLLKLLEEDPLLHAKYSRMLMQSLVPAISRVGIYDTDTASEVAKETGALEADLRDKYPIRPL